MRQTCPKWWLPAVSSTTSVRSVGIVSFLSGTSARLIVPVIWGSQTCSHMTETHSALLRSSERPSRTTCSLYCSTDSTIRKRFLPAGMFGWYALQTYRNALPLVFKSPGSSLTWIVRWVCSARHPKINSTSSVFLSLFMTACIYKSTWRCWWYQHGWSCWMYAKP